MTIYRDQLAAALRALEIVAPTSYAWFGRRSAPLPPALRAALPPAAAREHLVARLARELYRSFYTQGWPLPEPPRSATGVDQPLVERISRANTGRGGWDPGWRIETAGRAESVVARDGLRVRVRAADLRSAGGRAVLVRRPHELRAISPGFYTAIGDRGPAAGSGGNELRVYFNVSTEGAAPLMAACTRTLNEAGLAFSLKAAASPAGFLRRDAAVLYLGRGDFQQARASLRSILSTCGALLLPGEPAFTKRLAAGVGAAEHSAVLGGSFGEGRCRLVADGVVDAHENGASRLKDRLEAVARRFADAGIQSDFPYLAAGSMDRYAI